MSFTPIPNGVRIVHLGQINGTVQIVNTVGCQNGSGEVGSDLSALAKSHGDAWRQYVLPIIPSIYQHVATLAYSLEDQSAAAGDAGYSGGLVGGVSGSVTSLSNCVVASLKTAKRGRTYQGRMFLGPSLSASVATTGQTWISGHLAEWQNALASYKGAVDPAAGDNGRLAICSKGSPQHGIAPHVEPVTSILVRAAIGSQRRRLT